MCACCSPQAPPSQIPAGIRSVFRKTRPVLNQQVAKMEEWMGKQKRSQALHRLTEPTSHVLALHPPPLCWAVSGWDIPTWGLCVLICREGG